MKKETGKIKIVTATLLCVSMVLFAGCGAEDGAPKGDETGGRRTDSADTENAADSNEENPEKAQALYEAQIRHYYGGVLSQLVAAWSLPGYELGDSAGCEEMERNQFAVADVDQDGREELMIKWTTGITAGEFQAVYGYDPIVGEVKLELQSMPNLTFFANGTIKAEWLHNQVPPTEFWPFTIYQYESESDSYREIGSVRAWDKIEECDFPDEMDVDGDGRVFEIKQAGEDYSDYEGFKYNQSDFEEWFGGYTEGAKELSIDYQPLEYESFADYTPAYLKLKAEEAGRERTDTDADLGLLILNEEHFLDAAQTLLAEKYDVVMEQPEPNFEEYTVGLVDGKEVFSFTALDSGDLFYSGEKLEDVTIFGIYPGISVDGAWKKLQAYGFYASPYGEVENCLITGEGFGNISIWFSAEDGLVTDITVRPYCAFAG